jgi:hypothetical protein
MTRRRQLGEPHAREPPSGHFLSFSTLATQLCMNVTLSDTQPVLSA